MKQRKDAGCEITVFSKDGGILSKKIGLAKDGALERDGSECRMATGSACRAPIADVHALGDRISRLKRYQAITLGALRDGLPDKVKIVTKAKLNGAANTIARARGEIIYREKRPAFVLLDFDRDGMPQEVADRCKDFWGALSEVVPGLRNAARVVRASTSAGLFNSDSGESLGGSGGVHAYIMARDGADAERFLTTLHDRCWLHGLGWIKLSACGSMLERSIVDVSVAAPERLVFEAPPLLKKPLKQNQKSRQPVVHDGEVLDTRAACPPLTPDEQKAMEKLKAEARERIKPQAEKVLAAYVEKHVQEIVERTGMSKAAAVAQVRSRCRGVLQPDAVLAFVDKKLEGCTVGDVLADPERFDHAVLADPIEGVSYGRHTAMVLLRRSDGHPWIKSFAHGIGMSYTLESGADVGVKLENFYAYMPMNNYIFAPSRDPWPAESVNARIPPIVIGTNAKGEDITIKASVWIAKNQPVEQMTWAPGLPMIIADRLIANGGWIERKGVACFNLYRAPTIKPGDARKAGPWLRHVRKIYPAEADHIVKWFASRVQHPEIKINHALVLGSNDHGIGKDTLIEPVKRAVGSWNFDEVSPQMIMGEFTGFLRNVIMRVNEARDLGDVNRYQFYDRMKAYLAAPPDVLRVNEKFLREYSVANCVGVVITSNYKTNGIFLPAEDRRHYVAWSESVKGDFDDDYWKKLWGWYDAGGDRHVAAYLMSLDLSDFDPKAPPPKTPAFWAIVDANQAPEEGELADVLDKLANPAAVTLSDLIHAAGYGSDFHDWLDDRRNRRIIPHRLEAAGYIPVRNEARDTGLWVIGGVRQVVYAKKSLSTKERLKAVAKLQRKVAELQRKAAEAKKAAEGRQGKGTKF